MIKKNSNILLPLLYLLISLNVTAQENRTNDRLESLLEKSLHLVNVFQQQAQQTVLGFVTVGTDIASCTYISIGAAIANGATEIRVADGVYTENIVFNTSVTIKGGYASCTDATNNNQSSSQATIDGSGQDFPVISMIGNSSRDSIQLENLIITGGNAVNSSGGGILIDNMDAAISLVNITITNNNTGFSGGGLAIRSTVFNSTDMILTDTLIVNNTAPVGAGIYCSVINASASIVISGNSGVSANTARETPSNVSGKGGGMYLESCTMIMYSGTSQASSLLGVSSNVAEGEGGGIYAIAGSYVVLYGHENCSVQTCLGDNVNPVNLTDNNSYSGAAMYLSGSSTFAETYAILLNNNHSSLNGGAVAVFDTSGFSIGRLSKSCWDLDRCNFFQANTSNGNGGALYNTSPNVHISNAYFEDNRAVLGTVLYSRDSGKTKIENSVFNNNGNNGTDVYLDKYVLRIFNGATSEIIHSTFADNNATTAVFGVANNAGTTLDIYSSIVHDSSSGTFTDASDLGNLNLDCVIAHELSSVGGASELVIDPQFIDRGNRDYHIDATSSPAVDMCDIPFTTFTDKDLDFQARGWDDPTVVGSGHGFDAGADETYNNDIIFENDFEKKSP